MDGTESVMDQAQRPGGIGDPLTQEPSSADRSPRIALDRIFSRRRSRVQDFNFGEETTAVFDDMLDRSVPFYGEIQRMIGEMASDFARDGSQVFDLGCSTCNSFLAIDHFLPKDVNVHFIGIDSSPHMLDKARDKLIRAGFRHEFELRLGNLNQDVCVENASVVLLTLTLQFVRPLYRDALIARIYEGLNPKGCLILVEKVLGEDSTFNRLFIKYYYDMKKRNGYTELEIAQKREALENVLIPYRLQENAELLRRVGFKHIETFFKWYNFCGMIASKVPADGEVE